MKDYVKPDASPGVPCAYFSNRNDQYLSALGEKFNEIVLDRLDKILQIPYDVLRQMSRQERIDFGLVDPVRVFVKNEPHSRSKLDEGRVRLIMSVSLIDKMIEMLISRHVCKLEILNWETIPSKPGIGFTHQNNMSVYRDVVDSGCDMSYADISGWDWGVKQWQILDEAESLINLCQNPSSDWCKIVRSKAILESESIYQFSDGLMVMPTFKGIVNSGKLRTSRGNSWMRVRIANLIGANKVIAAGDDSVEQTVPDAITKYLKYGVRCKDYQPVIDTFEFCSHIYSKHGAYSINRNKMIMNLLHHKYDTFMEYKLSMIGFEDELRSRPDYEEILELVKSVGYYEVEGPHIEIYNTNE
jgi:hypothetical protein